MTFKHYEDYVIKPLRPLLAALTLAVLASFIFDSTASFAFTEPTPEPIAQQALEVPVETTTSTTSTTSTTTTTEAPIAVPEQKQVQTPTNSSGEALKGNALRVWNAFRDLGTSEASNAVTIAFCESSLKAGASNSNENGSSDYGLFQLNDSGTLQKLFKELVGYAPNQKQAYDAAMWSTWNIKAARELYNQRGWAPWACGAKTGVTDKLWSRNKGPSWGNAPKTR